MGHKKGKDQWTEPRYRRRKHRPRWYSTAKPSSRALNIAAGICERSVFLEKGQVRFEGATRDLMTRDDIARAVFLGSQHPQERWMPHLASIRLER
jgi:hypothetical protein